jgi:hypothetical protein
MEKKSHNSCSGTVAMRILARYPRTSVEEKTAEGVRPVRKINPSQCLEARKLMESKGGVVV